MQQSDKPVQSRLLPFLKHEFEKINQTIDSSLIRNQQRTDQSGMYLQGGREEN